MSITANVVSNYFSRRDPSSVLNLINDFIQLKVDQASLKELGDSIPSNVMMDITNDIYEATELSMFITSLVNLNNINRCKNQK